MKHYPAYVNQGVIGQDQEKTLANAMDPQGAQAEVEALLDTYAATLWGMYRGVPTGVLYITNPLFIDM